MELTDTDTENYFYAEDTVADEYEFMGFAPAGLNMMLLWGFSGAMLSAVVCILSKAYSRARIAREDYSPGTFVCYQCARRVSIRRQQDIYDQQNLKETSLLIPIPVVNVVVD